LGQRALARLAAGMLEREITAGLSRAEAESLVAPLFMGPGGKSQIDPDEFLDDALARRLLIRHRGRVQFRHSLAGAFCAATALAAEPDATVPGQTDAWARALYCYAPSGDLGPAVARRLEQAPDLLHADLFACARWLRDTPVHARWRNDVLRRLSKLLADGKSPFGLRARALAAFALAADPGVAALFKQNLSSPDPTLRQLSLLGLGALDEISTLPQVAALLTDPQVEVRWAAALVLSVLGHASAVEELAKGLLSGDDTLRRACAEALARQPEEGHPVLQEAIQHPDLSVRRAAVYGLAATQADWARALLESVQVHEQEWFVRSAAQDILSQWKDPTARLPRPYAPPEQQAWLVTWAAERGLGVPPGRGAVEVLTRALLEGDEPTRRAAAGALGRLGDPSGARELYPLLRDANPNQRAAAFDALAQIGLASGQRMAAPV
jgi:HEAT repeat protein